MSEVKVEYTLEAFAQAEHWCRMAHQKFQKAQDDLEILKETAKDYLEYVKTDIDKKYMEEGLSETKLERMARASDDWKAFRMGQFEAQRLAGEMRVKYNNALRYYETIQSGLAYKREEIKRLG